MPLSTTSLYSLRCWRSRYTLKHGNPWESLMSGWFCLSIPSMWMPLLYYIIVLRPFTHNTAICFGFGWLCPFLLRDVSLWSRTQIPTLPELTAEKAVKNTVKLFRYVCSCASLATLLTRLRYMYFTWWQAYIAFLWEGMFCYDNFAAVTFCFLAAKIRWSASEGVKGLVLIVDPPSNPSPRVY